MKRINTILQYLLQKIEDEESALICFMSLGYTKPDRESMSLGYTKTK